MKFYFPDAPTNTNIAGDVINKGDTFEVPVYADGNNNTSARSLYFDFEFTNTAFEFLSVNHTGTGGNGGILPYGSQISMSHNIYPGYTYVNTQLNNSTNGNVKYQYANYSYTSNGPRTILRVYLNWAIAQGAVGKDVLLKLRFKLKTTAPGYTFDPIKLNFVAAYNQNGTDGSTLMTAPLANVIMLDPTASKYITASIETNANIDNFTLHRVALTDSATNQVILVDALSDGSIPVDQTLLKPNTVYHARLLVNMDSMVDLIKSAVTVSDYTTAQAEFNTQNLDGTFKGQSIITGAGYYAADINRNRKFDGGDLVRLFAQTVGVDSLLKLPAQYRSGTDMYMSVPTFTDSTYNNMKAANWKDVANNYVSFKTQEIGKNLRIKMKFLLPGDINRSHSSQVMINGSIATNAIPSLKKSIAASPTANIMINTAMPVPSIDVSLKGTTVTSSTIDIPVKINTGASSVAALQFEFTYDPAKIKFEQLFNEFPNTWFTFVDNKPGRIRFGAIDKEVKNPITGELTPFKLRFSAIGNPLDINTYIKVTPNMDAASKTGYQLGINLSTDAIKLTGYNNF
jgi:hypothetical protein